MCDINRHLLVAVLICQSASLRPYALSPYCTYFSGIAPLTLSLGQGCIFSIDEIIYNARKNYEYTTAHWRGSKVAWHHPKNYTLLSQGGFAGRTAAHRKRLPA